MIRFLPLLMILMALVACASPAAAPAPTAAPPAVSELQLFVAADDFAVGAPRVPLVLYDGPEVATAVQAVSVGLYDLSQDPPVETWSGPATGFTDYEVPYWVIYPRVPRPGNWGLGLTITLADGGESRASAVIAVADASAAPDIGDRPPASRNRTLATVADIAELTSGADPVPGLYQMTVAEALASARPTVVTFATPAFCASQLCAPVVDSVEAVFADAGERANFIHLEIYKSFNPLVVADEVTEWNLPSEPWTYVLDESGVIVARFGGPVSPRELRQALDEVIG